MFQICIVVGNLGSDPEMRFTASGQPVTKFPIAANRRWRDRETDELREQTTWFRVTTWGRLAETCNQYLLKGRQVLVVGRIQTSSWEDEDGNTRYGWDLTASEVRFLGNRGEITEELPDAPEEPDDSIPF
jgi:single-strand DNA-binding protein